MRPTKCLVIVALVAMLTSLVGYHKPTTLPQQSKPKPAVRVSIPITPPATPAPAPQPAPTPAPSPVVSTPPPTVSNAANPCSAYDNLFRQYAWDISVAEAICMAESRGNPNAVSPTDDHGLMQINHGLAIYGTAIYDPAFNIKIAFTAKYASSGWYPWTTFTSGSYLRYL